MEARSALAARLYDSFNQAANQALASRLHGGIHFMYAIVNCQAQGRAVGDWVVQNVKKSIIPALIKKDCY